MTDSRQRRKAKQARRDARRSRQRHDSPEESPLLDELRDALDSGEPMELLGLAGLIVAATAPPQLSLSRHDDGDSMSLGELVDSFVEVGIRETTALLAVFAEILVDDDVLRDRCRRAVAARDDDLPPWLVDLSKTRVERAVRMTHVLGDGDELLVEMSLADGRPLTCAAFIDHNLMSMIKDAFFVPSSLEEVLDVARRSNDDPDTTFVDMTLADTRAWLAHGLEYPWFAQDESDTWPASRALVQWLVARLPEGGARYEACELDWGQREQLLDRFFASLVGMRFANPDHRELLELCIDENNNDPLRWSDIRLGMILSEPLEHEFDHVSAEPQLDVPDLLRAFVPFAHAERGIRQELTVAALTAIDEAEADYRQAVLEEASQWEDDEDD